ncbi:MAG: glycosyl transferase family 1 [Bacteroidetes bacterium]|nr:MAG: glycosyl transferase family 1 [Bacteroidota bacterium]
MKRVLIISYYWPPSAGAGVQRWLKFTKYLPQHGWTPVVYTPENPEAPALDASLERDIPLQCEVIKQPIFEPYDLYKRFTGRQKEEKVNAGFLHEGRKPGGKDRIAVWIRGNLFIPDARRFWVSASVKYLAKYLEDHPVDVMVSTGPPHSMHLIAMALKKRFSIPWVADFRDPWTGIDFYDQLMLTRYADRKHHRLERKVLQGADEVLTIGWESARQLQQLGGRPVAVITNGFDEEDLTLQPLEREEGAPFVIRHLGAMNRDRNHDNFWQAVRWLVEDPAFEREVSVELIGKNDVAVRDSVERYGLEKVVQFVPYVAHEKVGTLLQSADLLYLALNNTANARGILTGKLFEYLASGTPILGVGPVDGDAAKVLEQCHAGVMKAFGEPFHIHPSWASREGEKRDEIASFSRRALTGKLVEILDSLI